MNINAEEKELLAQATSIESVEDIMSSYLQEVDARRSSQSKTWKKVHTFSKFAGRVLDIFKTANFSPECSVALGFVRLLLIQPLNNKSEIEERLEFEIAEIGEVLAQVEFTNTVVSTAEVQIEIQGLCATIIDFLVQALQYQKKWSIVRIMSSIVADFSKRFQSFIVKIKRHTSKIEILAQRTYTTILIQSKEILDSSSQALYQLQSRTSTHANFTARTLSGLQDDLLRLQQIVVSNSRLDAIKYTHQLSRALLPKAFDIPDPKLHIDNEEVALAPRERWEHNVSQIQAPGWVHRDPRPLLWIGGRQNRRGVSWVSSFSIDLVKASELERGVEIAYVSCNNGDREEKQVPVLLFKKLTLQLLKKYPEILSVPDYLNELSIERFEQVCDSPEKSFKILSDILNMVDIYCQPERKETFLLIDRVDLCEFGAPQERQRFFKAIQQLRTQYKTLRIILTGQCPWESIGVSLDKEAVTEVWVDTTKPLAMHSRR